jgi:hypothetical protein
MIGRRSAAWLCVLLAHAVIIFLLARLGPAAERRVAEPEIAAITLFAEAAPVEIPAASVRARAAPPAVAHRAAEAPANPAPATPAVESAPITLTGRVDWPIEGQKSAARVLAREAEAARIAKMFSGPGGTWASLTPREKSKLKKFRWKPGVDGLEYDEHGNAIYHVSDGCVVVNLLFFACTIGKEKAHGDLFEHMREYFDEQRRPELDDGNGNDDATRR